MTYNKFLLRKIVFILTAYSFVFMPKIGFAVDKTPSVTSYSANKISVNQYKAAIKAKSSKKIKAKIRKTKKISSKKNKIIKQEYFDPSGPLAIASEKALVINQHTGATLFAKNTNVMTPIASLTKLMTAMVMLDAHLPMDEVIFISDGDIDYLKGTHSRLAVGMALTRAELLELALMSSENRAASALSRIYPGGRSAFITAMNTKAAMLGMQNTQFVDSTGLNSQNISTADDLVKMVNAAYQYDEIRQVTTTPSHEVAVSGRNPLNYVNTNALVRGGQWNIGLSKTGYINEAGRCLVMQAEIAGQPMIIVLLDSDAKQDRLNDARRIRDWYEYHYTHKLATNERQKNYY